MNGVQSLISELKNGRTTALARAISIIEDNSRKARELVSGLFGATGKAHVIGVTGSPGAGKSTLVDCMIQELVERGKKVAVLAIDPSSPFSGGALLGDRIRMNKALSRKGVFVRSMASRGAIGGLAPFVSESIFALDAAGFDTILIETVGVGQGEVDIIKTADSVIVVVVPGMGDGVQALKAGIMEIADIFAINKADYDGVMRLERELTSLLSLGGDKSNTWKSPVIKTVATTGEGIVALTDMTEQHFKMLSESGLLEKRREEFLLSAFNRALVDVTLRSLNKAGEGSEKCKRIKEKVLRREIDPYNAALEYTESIKDS